MGRERCASLVFTFALRFFFCFFFNWAYYGHFPPCLYSLIIPCPFKNSLQPLHYVFPLHIYFNWWVVTTFVLSTFYLSWVRFYLLQRNQSPLLSWHHRFRFLYEFSFGNFLNQSKDWLGNQISPPLSTFTIHNLATLKISIYELVFHHGILYPVIFR